MSARLKRILGVLLATAPLLVAIPALLPAQAKAQNDAPAYEVNSASALDAQLDAHDVRITEQTAAAAPQELPTQPATRVVLPGDTLWTIAQERLGPDAPADLITAEAELIFEFNRERVGPDPNLILPGQELLLTEGQAEGAGQPTTDSTPDAPSAEPKDERAADASQADPVPTDSPPTDSRPTDASSRTNPEQANPGQDRMVYTRYGVLELTLLAGLFLFSLAVGAFGAAKLIRTRRKLSKHIKPSLPEGWIEARRHHGAHDAPLHHERETDGHDAEAPEPAIAGSRTPTARASAADSEDQT